jgi:hypothetical protein
MNDQDCFPPERRCHTRTQLQITLRGIRLDPGGEMVDTFHTVDISRGGMGAIVDRPYYRGQRVVLNLPGLLDGPRRNVYAVVVRCRSDAQGYKVGMQFDGVGSSLWADAGAIAAAAAAA